jgi:hypothetical protein
LATEAVAQQRISRSVLAGPGKLLAGKHIYHTRAADAGFHHHHARVFVRDLADDAGIFCLTHAIVFCFDLEAAMKILQPDVVDLI